MFLIDDILFSPFTGLLHIFREIHRAAFEVAVRSSQLAFVLRDLATPITWH